MLAGLKMLVARVARGRRPIWTLLAISYLFSAVIVMALRCAFNSFGGVLAQQRRRRQQTGGEVRF